jgi:hypothetical protein
MSLVSTPVDGNLILFPQKARSDTFDNSDLYRDVRVLGTNSKDCNVFLYGK